jgi:hypothetical protein
VPLSGSFTLLGLLIALARTSLSEIPPCPAKSAQYSASVQQQFPGNVTLSIAYVGARPTRLEVNHNINVLPAQYYNLGAADVFAENARQHGMAFRLKAEARMVLPSMPWRPFAMPCRRLSSGLPTRIASPIRAAFYEGRCQCGSHLWATDRRAGGEISIRPQWSESLATNLKPSFDMGITEGMNRLVWHEFNSSPASTGFPGQEYFAGSHSRRIAYRVTCGILIIAVELKDIAADAFNSGFGGCTDGSSKKAALFGLGSASQSKTLE